MPWSFVILQRKHTQRMISNNDMQDTECVVQQNIANSCLTSQQGPALCDAVNTFLRLLFERQAMPTKIFSAHLSKYWVVLFAHVNPDGGGPDAARSQFTWLWSSTTEKSTWRGSRFPGNSYSFNLAVRSFYLEKYQFLQPTVYLNGLEKKTGGKWTALRLAPYK